MSSGLIPISFDKIKQSRAYSVIILGTEKKKFAIYTEPQVGKLLQTHLTQESPLRPLTHDFLNTILKGINAKILQVVIHDVQDTVYLARIFIEQDLGEKKLILEIDARPSDCLALAIMNNIPIFCRKEVLDKTIPVQD